MLFTRFQKPHFGIGPQLSDDLNSPGTLDLDILCYDLMSNSKWSLLKYLNCYVIYNKYHIF